MTRFCGFEWKLTLRNRRKAPLGALLKQLEHRVSGRRAIVGSYIYIIRPYHRNRLLSNLAVFVVRCFAPFVNFVITVFSLSMVKCHPQKSKPILRRPRYTSKKCSFAEKMDFQVFYSAYFFLSQVVKESWKIQKALLCG